jgi:hypothetical protein
MENVDAARLQNMAVATTLLMVDDVDTVGAADKMRVHGLAGSASRCRA